MRTTRGCARTGSSCSTRSARRQGRWRIFPRSRGGVGLSLPPRPARRGGGGEQRSCEPGEGPSPASLRSAPSPASGRGEREGRCRLLRSNPPSSAADGFAHQGVRTMTVSIGHLQPIVALIAGVLILVMPRLLNFIVAIYLIIIGVIGLGLIK